MFIQKLGIIGRTYKHAQRYRTILGVLIKYGFDDLVAGLNVDEYLEVGLKWLRFSKKEGLEKLTRGERVKMALEELGPTFIKLGQVLSTRTDLLPVEVISELPKLQDTIPPFPYEEVRKIVEEELQKPIENAFDSFEETPLSAASIGQVHRARTIDGEDVVVKVQRPDIWKIIEVDLEIMLHVATLMERHLEGFDIHRPTLIVEEFSASLEKELDYTVEASYMERFAAAFADDETVYVPKVYQGTTTKRLLTMEFIDGVKPRDMEELDEDGFDRPLLAERGARLIMKQVFELGVLHADPHPGNIMILQNNVFCYLDFGMMARIDNHTREIFADFMLGFVQRDEAKTTDALLLLTVYDEEPDRYQLERDVGDFMDQHMYKPLRQVAIAQVLQQLFIKAAKHRLRVRPHLFMILKALSMAESLGRDLDPNFDIAQQAAPFLQKVHMKRLNPAAMAREALYSGAELFRILRKLPYETREFLRQVKKGRVKMDFEHRGLEPMLNTLERVSNRLSFAIVLASLVIGSSLIIRSNISYLGVLGFIVAGLMAFWLLISIIRHGQM